MSTTVWVFGGWEGAGGHVAFSVVTNPLPDSDISEAVVHNTSIGGSHVWCMAHMCYMDDMRCIWVTPGACDGVPLGKCVLRDSIVWMGVPPGAYEA